MARTPLPRYRTTVTLDLEVAARHEEDALLEAALVVERLRPVVERAVRNHGSRTSRALGITVDPSGLGPDCMAQQ